MDKYHINNHSSTGLPPLKMWSYSFLPQLPESMKMLDLLLLTIHKPRKVQRDGIQFQGMRYIAPTLAGFVGELITIRYDPRNLAEIKVYYQESFLCKAVCQEIAELVVSLKDIQAARKKVKNGFYQQIKKSQLLVKSIVQNKESEKTTNQLVTKAFKKDAPNKSPLKLYDNE